MSLCRVPLDRCIQASWIAPDGAVYVSSSNRLYKSTDGSDVWLPIKDFNCQGIDCVYVSKNNRLFVSPGVDARECGLWMSGDGGISWKKTLPLPESCSVWNVAEDLSGCLYAGVYTRGERKKAAIFKSSDDGRTWRQCYYDSSARHIHHVAFDQQTGYVYASVGDKSVPQSNTAYLIRTIDAGKSWRRLLEELPQILAIECIAGVRYFGTDDSCNGQLYRTTDDLSIEKVLETPGHSYCFWIRKIGVSGVLASFVSGEANNKTAGIYYSEDSGLHWAPWVTFAAIHAYEGSSRATNFCDGRLFYSVRLNGVRTNGVKAKFC